MSRAQRIITGILVIFIAAGSVVYFFSGTIRNVYFKLNPHECIYEGDVCAFCGRKCTHPEYDTNGNCVSCGIPCGHPSYSPESMTCTVCGVPCNHREREPRHEAVCLLCGKVLEHIHDWDNSVCILCGAGCSHSWDSSPGICSACGAGCPHTAHDSESLECLNCGMITTHNFVSGRCTLCGTDLTLLESLPDSYFRNADERGTVETIAYHSDAHYDWARRYDFDNTALVYLPYGYNPQEKYNVLLLVHPMNGNAEDWLLTMQQFTENPGEKETNGCRILDRMIAENIIDPLIVVSVNTLEAPYENLDSEFRNELLPAVISSYSTYASGGSIEEIRAARDHFAIAGASNGALVTLYSGMLRGYDIFSHFGAYSGNPGVESNIIALTSEEWAELDMSYFYTSAGAWDPQKLNVSTNYSRLVGEIPGISDGINSCLHVIPGSGHDWNSWFISLYNSLQVFFSEKP